MAAEAWIGRGKRDRAEVKEIKRKVQGKEKEDVERILDYKRWRLSKKKNSLERVSWTVNQQGVG